MALVERDAELAAVVDVVTAAVRGDGGVALVNGPVGVGKTELLRAARAAAAQAGCAVLHAAGSAAERAVPFGVVAQLFRHNGLPPRLAEEVAGIIGRARTSGTPAADSEAVHELCATVLDRADEGPVLVVVDDVQHADQFSLRFLLSLVHQLHSARILVLLAELQGADQASSPLLRAEVLRHGRGRRIRLDPLSRTGVQRAIADRLGTRAALKLATSCHTASGGNPFLVHALVEDHVAATAERSRGRSTGLALGDFFREAVVACVHRCGPRAVEIARAAAVLGGACSTDRLAALTGVAAHDVDRIARGLTASGLLHAGGFRQRVANDAVLAELDARAHDRLRLRAAELLHGEGTPAPEVARQLVAVAEVSGTWAVDVLKAAAEHALLDGDVRVAERYLDRADRACADDRERAPVLALLARLGWQTSPSSVARHLSRLAASDVRALPAPLATPVIGYLLWHGRVEQARQAVAVPDAPPSTDRVVEFWVSHNYQALLGRVPATALTALARAELGVDAVTAGPLLQAVTALVSVLVDGPDDHAVAAAECVLQGNALSHRTVDAVRTALETLVHADEPDLAVRWCDDLVAEASRQGAPAWQAVFTAIRARIALRLGDLAGAECHARSALALLPAEGWGVGIGEPLACLVLASTAMGNLDEAERHLARPVPEAMADTGFGVAHRYARARLHLASGRLQAAFGDFRACGELLAHRGLDLPALLPWRTDLAEVNLRLGRTEQARDLAERQVELLNGARGRARALSLRALAATDRTNRTVELLTEASDLLRDCGDRLGLAVALSDLCGALLDVDEVDQAQLVVRRAFHVARSCQAGPLCTELSRGPAGRWIELPAIGVDGADTLSDAERKVAGMAAAGRANREIARTLFITISTVEQHLTKAYRKLNVSRRKDLPPDLFPDIADTA